MSERARQLTKREYVDRIVGWLMPKRAPEMVELVGDITTLDGLYCGRSVRIRRLIRAAYLRGCRRGAGCAWSAAQPITLRTQAKEQP